MKNTKTFLKLSSRLFLGMGIISGSSIKSGEAAQNRQPDPRQCARAKSFTERMCAEPPRCKAARKKEEQQCGQARKPDSHSPATPPAKADPAVSGNKSTSAMVCPKEITLQELIKLRSGESVGGWVLDKDHYEYMPDTIEGLQTVVEFLKGEKKITQIKGGLNKWCKYGSIPPDKHSYIVLRPKK